MGVTAPSDISAWAPKIVSTTLKDLMFDSTYALSEFAEKHDELEGKPGDTINFPTLNSVTPADNLAVTTAAVDDLLTGGSVPMVIKEGVKSIAWYDRTEYVTNVASIEQLAGQKCGQALALRVELDLGAAVYAGRNTSADGAATTLNLQTIRQMRAKLPAQLRPGLGRDANKPVLFAENDTLSMLFEDTTVANAAAFGSGDVTETGDFVRPFYGIRTREVDAGLFGTAGLAGQQKWAALILPGALGRAIQKQASTELERDARARLTRTVGTMNHAEGVLDSRGVVMFKIGSPT